MQDLSLTEKLKIFYKYHLATNPAHSPIQETKLGLVPLDLDLEDYYSQLLKYSSIFNVQPLQIIHYNNKKFPIYSIKVNSKPKNQNLLITAGIHGNEHAGLLAILKILQDIVTSADKYRYVNINFITPVNPVGVLKLSRYNAEGKDINRDFCKFETKEAITLKKELKRFKPNFVIDLHEGPQSQGTFIYTHQKVTTETIKFIFNYLNQKNLLLSKQDYFGRKLKTNGLAQLGKTFTLIEILWQNLFKKKQFGSFAISQNIPTIAVESPWRDNNKKERINAHVYTIQAVTKYLLRN